MLKALIGGIAVGIANVIPGVSGGTMMIIMGIFNKVMDSISGVFQPKNPDRLKNIIFLFEVLVGAAVGIVGFAKVLEFLFNYYSTQTIYWFIGLVAFSIPAFKKSQIRDDKINVISLLVGMAVIFLITFLNPGESTDVNPAFPTVTAFLCVKMVIVGFIGGFTMLLPGVSGSMVLLIIGQYYLFKSYLANITQFSLQILIPLFFAAIGIALGIIASAKITSFALKKNKNVTLSFLLGLIIASAIVLIPINVVYTPMIIVTSAVAFVLGGIIITLLSRLTQ